MADLIAMLSRAVSLALAAAAIILAASDCVHAQEGVPPMPDSSYGAAANTYPSPADAAMPAPDDMTNPNIVTIPIPGGGDITVDGPDAPADKPLPTLPGSTWGTQQQTPFTHGTGPVGP